MDTKSKQYYCPFCARNIEPLIDDDDEPMRSPDGGLVYVHDEVPHDEDFKYTELN